MSNNYYVPSRGKWAKGVAVTRLDADQNYSRGKSGLPDGFTGKPEPLYTDSQFSSDFSSKGLLERRKKEAEAAKLKKEHIVAMAKEREQSRITKAQREDEAQKELARLVAQSKSHGFGRKPKKIVTKKKNKCRPLSSRKEKPALTHEKLNELFNKYPSKKMGY